MNDREEPWIWMKFYSTPHPKCQCWINETHGFKNLPFLLTCSLCVSNRRVKNRKILFTERELKGTESTDASLGCKWWNPSLKSHPPSSETFTYKWPPGTLLWIRPHNLVTSYECVMRVSYTPQDLPLVTSKHLFKPHSPLECTRVAHERWTEWGKSFHSSKEVVFPKYFFPPESSAYFSQEGGGLTGNELMALFVFAVQEFRG